MQDNLGLYIKAALASFFTAISLRFGAVGNLMWLFIAAVILDYITGIMAGAYNRELSSSVGIRGVLKKVGQFIVIAVALICDEVVSQSAGHLGATISTGGAITAVITIWLILNELISILENLAKLNIDLPPFFMKAIRLLKKQAEAEGGKLETDSSEEDKRPQS